MKPLQQKKKSKRLYSAVAMIAGFVLLGFEIRNWETSPPEKWFWVLVAGLMIALGLAGMVMREDLDDDSGTGDQL